MKMKGSDVRAASSQRMPAIPEAGTVQNPRSIMLDVKNR